MSAKKFEKLIDLIINEDQEKAEQLFHDIVVEKSRQIYESLINEDQSMGFLDEIEDEDAGMDGMMEDEEGFEADEEVAGDFDVDGEEGEFDDEVEFGDEGEGEEEIAGEEDEESPATKGDILDLEDKLDDILAQFEAEMGGEEVDLGDEEEEEGEEEEEEGEEEESGVMESVELKKVPGLYGSKIGGDDGAQKKSPGLQNPKRVGTGGAPVKFADGGESVPTSPKAPSNAYAKGQKEEDFGNVNKVGGDASKGAKAPAAVKTQASGVNTKSPVSESRKAQRRI